MNTTRPIFPDARRRTRLNEIDRLEQGFLDHDETEETTCDLDTGCPAWHHRGGCRGANDPLRNRNSLRAVRVG